MFVKYLCGHLAEDSEDCGVYVRESGLHQPLDFLYVLRLFCSILLGEEYSAFFPELNVFTTGETSETRSGSFKRN